MLPHTSNKHLVLTFARKSGQKAIRAASIYATISLELYAAETSGLKSGLGLIPSIPDKYLTLSFAHTSGLEAKKMPNIFFIIPQELYITAMSG